MSETLLLARLMREALNIQCRRYLRETVPIDELLTTVNEGLGARLGHLDWLAAHLDSPRESDERPGWLRVVLHAHLTDEAGRQRTITEPFQFDRRW